jgi:hypothetical protein
MGEITASNQGHNQSTSSNIPGPQSPLCKDCQTALDRWGSEKDIAKAGDGRPSRGPPETVLLQVNSRLIDRVATGCRLCTMIYESFEGETRSFESTTFRTKRYDLEALEKPEIWGYMRTWRSGGRPNEIYEETDLSIRRWQPKVDMKFSVRLHRVGDKGCTGMISSCKKSHKSLIIFEYRLLWRYTS